MRIVESDQHQTNRQTISNSLNVLNTQHNNELNLLVSWTLLQPIIHANPNIAGEKKKLQTLNIDTHFSYGTGFHDG